METDRRDQLVWASGAMHAELNALATKLEADALDPEVGGFGSKWLGSLASFMRVQSSRLVWEASDAPQESSKEMAAGKPQKHAVAIALDMARRSKKGKK